jgi:hypothetical protein
MSVHDMLVWNGKHCIRADASRNAHKAFGAGCSSVVHKMPSLARLVSSLAPGSSAMGPAFDIRFKGSNKEYAALPIVFFLERGARISFISRGTDSTPTMPSRD